MALQTDIITIQDVLYKHVYCPDYFITVGGIKYVCALLKFDDDIAVAATNQEIEPTKDKDLPGYISHLIKEGLYTTILLVGTSRDNLFYINDDVKNVLLNLTNIDTLTFFFRDADELTRQTIAQISEIVDASMQEKFYNIHKTELQEESQALQDDYNAKIDELNSRLQTDYDTKIDTLNTNLSTDYNGKVNTLNTNLSTSIGNEVIARSAATDTLNTNITTVNSTLDTKIDTNYNTLDNKINTNYNTLNTKIDNAISSIQVSGTAYEYNGSSFTNKDVVYVNSLNTNITSASSGQHSDAIWLYSTPVMPYVPLTLQNPGTSNTFSNGGMVICPSATNVTIGQGNSSLTFTGFVGILPVSKGAVVTTNVTAYFSSY